MISDLTIKALEMALENRKPSIDLAHHSDKGNQHSDQEHRALLKAHGIQARMNGIGSWYDSAPLESFFGILKCERIHHCIYRTQEEARTDLFCYIEARYN